MVLIFSRSDVIAVAHDARGTALDTLIDRVQEAYAELADDVVRQHSRIYLRPEAEGSRRPPGLFSMSALLPRTGRMGTRLMAITTDGKAGDGILVLFDHKNSVCLSIVDDSLLHNYRSGAPAGLATRYLARPESEVVACFGSSGIAMGGLIMTCRSLPNLKAVNVYSPSKENRTRFAEEMERELGVEVRAADTPDDAAGNADVIVAGTNADRPVVSDEAIRPGTHVNILARNEVEMATFDRARVVLGSRQAQRELDPPWSNPIPDEWIDCELTDMVASRASSRTQDDDLTVFVGSGPLPMWDVAAASVFYEHGQTMGLGTEIEMSA